jgi:hypothetical protein
VVGGDLVEHLKEGKTLAERGGGCEGAAHTGSRVAEVQSSAGKHSAAQHGAGRTEPGCAGSTSPPPCMGPSTDDNAAAQDPLAGFPRTHSAQSLSPVGPSTSACLPAASSLPALCSGRAGWTSDAAAAAAAPAAAQASIIAGLGA